MKRIGVIGIGKMGLSHLANVNGLKLAEIIAVADTNYFVLKGLKRFSNIKVYNDYKKMMELENLDGVIICLPSHLHYQACLDCIDYNISFFIEKPFTLSPEQSQEIINKSKMKKIKGMVGYVNRYSEIFKLVKEIINNNILGEIYDYRSLMTGSVIKKESKSSWRNKISEGGGCLYDYGSHAIDLAIYLFNEIEEVLGATMLKIYSNEAEDMVNAIVKHKNGIRGNVYVNWCDNTQRKAYNQIEIYGKNGKLIADKQEIRIFLNEIEENNRFMLKRGWNIRYITDLNKSVPYYLRGEEFTNELVDFIKMLELKDYYPKSNIDDCVYTDIAISEIRKNADHNQLTN